MDSTLAHIPAAAQSQSIFELLAGHAWLVWIVLIALSFRTLLEFIEWQFIFAVEWIIKMRGHWKRLRAEFKKEATLADLVGDPKVLQTTAKVEDVGKAATKPVDKSVPTTPLIKADERLTA